MANDTFIKVIKTINNINTKTEAKRMSDNNNIKTVELNKVSNRIDKGLLKYRFFGHTINKEEFKFNIKAYSYRDATSDLFRMLNVNYIWLLNCEMPGRHSHMNYHAGKTHSIDLIKYQQKN
jgi:hypothetical protein